MKWKSLINFLPIPTTLGKWRRRTRIEAAAIEMFRFEEAGGRVGFDDLDGVILFKALRDAVTAGTQDAPSQR